MSLITDLDVLENTMRREWRAWYEKCAALEDEIERLKSERRWIPVSERLPKTSNVVLAFAGFVVDFLSYFDSEWHVMFDEDWTACHVLNYPLITHWMPLPTPPEDE